jgi:hypothetical protein
MDEEVGSRSRHYLLRQLHLGRPSFAGTGMTERLRSTTFALLGLTAAAGLGLVAIFSQPGWPILETPPIAGPLSRPDAVADAVPLRGPSGGGVSVALRTLATAPAASGEAGVGGPATNPVAGAPSQPGGSSPGSDHGGSSSPVTAPAGSPAPSGDPTPAPQPVAASEPPQSPSDDEPATEPSAPGRSSGSQGSWHASEKQQSHAESKGTPSGHAGSGVVARPASSHRSPHSSPSPTATAATAAGSGGRSATSPAASDSGPGKGNGNAYGHSGK